MTPVRDFLDSDFDETVARWHQTNLVSYPYVQVHQEHSLEDARQFFRDTVLPECRVWVAERVSQPIGLLALCDSWIRQLTVFPSFQSGVSERRCCKRLASTRQDNCGCSRFDAITRHAYSTSEMDRS